MRGEVGGAVVDELLGAQARDEVKVLTHTLRRLEGSGLVARHAYAEAPPRVEYELTELGSTLIDPIKMLAPWAEANGDAILDAQDRT
jgi:DNA-binding HxlR family transcriptional regulator